MPAQSTNLNKANRAKNDEFYTQLSDIENELENYVSHFADKVVYCNCDDPLASQFFHYFSHNFKHLRWQKLIATCYKNTDPTVFSTAKTTSTFSNEDAKKAVYLRYAGFKNGEVMPDLQQIQICKLQGDGDFRSSECIALLQEADIVVTNPPFSLFREYVAQLIAYDKKFVIIGNMNALTYKEIFKLIKDNKIWLGAGFQGGNAYFKTPNPKDFANGVFNPATELVKFRNVIWFTNLDIAKRHEKLFLHKQYTATDYPKYDNYDAINVDKVADIPCDYAGVMGVPITFMDKFNPDQFEIIGLAAGNIKGLAGIQSITGKDGPYMNGKLRYGRIFIKNKTLGDRK